MRSDVFLKTLHDSATSSSPHALIEGEIRVEVARKILAGR